MADADETIVTRFVVDTADALTQAQKFREQVDALKAQLQQLVQQSKMSVTDVAEGMKRARTGLSLGDQLDPTAVKNWNKALSVAASEAQQEFKKSEQAAKGLDTELKSKPKDAGAVSSAFSRLGDITRIVFGTILGLSAIQALRKFVSAVVDAIGAGYELEKSIYRAGVAIQSLQFRGVNASAEKTVKMVQDLRREFGTLSEKEAIDVVANTQLLTRNLGFAEDQIKNVIRVSTALAIVQGKDVAESARQLVLFFSSGYGEGLQKAGIAVNRFTVAQEAMKMGFGKSYMALTEQQRAAAAYSLVMKQTGEIVALAGGYQETAAGQVDMMNKEIETQVSLIGSSLLPLKQQWLTLELQVIGALNKVNVSLAKYDLGNFTKRLEELQRKRNEILNQPMPEAARNVWLKSLDDQIAGVESEIERVQKIIDTGDPAEKLEKDLKAATAASEAAAKSLARFSAGIEKKIVLDFGTEEAKKGVDELQKKIDVLKGDLGKMDLASPEAKKKLIELAALEDEITKKRHDIVVTMDPADAIRTINEIDLRLTELNNQIDNMHPLTLGEQAKKESLSEEAKKLSQYKDILTEVFDIQPLEGISQGIDQINKLTDELKELQKYRDVLIRVGADTTEIDGAIKAKEREIETTKVQLSIMLHIDESELDAFLANFGDFSLAAADSITQLNDLVKDTNADLLKAEQDFYAAYGSVGEQDLGVVMNQWDTFFSQTEGMSDEAFYQMLDGASRFYDNYGTITLDGLEKAADIWRTYWDKIAQINTNEQEAIAKENTDFTDSLSSLRSDTQDKLKEAARKYHDAEIKAERDYQEKLRRLREEYLFDLEDALRERDALQVLRLMRRYNLDKEQTTRQYDQEQQERRDAYRQELADIREQARQKEAELRKEHAQRLAEIRAQAERERAEAARTRDDAMAELKRDLENERNERQAKYAQELEDIKKRFQDDLNEILTQLGLQYSLTNDQLKLIGGLYDNLLGPDGTIANAYDAFAITMGNIDATIAAATQNAINNLAILQQAAAQAAALQSSYGTGVGTAAPYKPMPHAAGGTFLATRPTLALYGEAGPEMATFTPMNKVGAGGNGKARIEVWLSKDLEARIVDNTLNQSAQIIEESLSRR